MNAKTKRRLLVVDDEPYLQEIICDVCVDIADQVITANNGQEALKIVLAGGIDAIVSDLKMPVMSGLQFLAELRSRNIETPFVIVTGYSDMKNTAEALRLGASDFIEKPFQPKQLLTVIDRALTLGVAQRELDEQLDLVFKNSNLPYDKIIQLKKAKRSVWMMKIDMDIYTKKKSA